MSDIVYGAEVLVVGRRINGSFWGYNLNESGYENNPQLVPGASGGGAPPWENQLYEPHYAICASKQDAAKSIADKIMSTDDGGSQNSYKRYEYGAIIARYNTEGEFHAFRSRVHTDWAFTWVNLGAPPEKENVGGTIHNHPSVGRTLQQQLIGRYPSQDDMDRFDQLIADDRFPADASLFILDAFDEMREFKASDFSSIRGASDADLQAGVGLPNTITVANCRSLQP